MRHRMFVWGLAAISLLLFQGCATLSEDECLTADWRTIGFEDGARGISSRNISKHREACAEYGITPDFAIYRAGHREGLREYCVPTQGFALGRSGKRYNNICPPNLEPGFLAAYGDGQAVYNLQQDLNRLQGDIRRARGEQEALQRDIESNEAMIVSDTTSRHLRRELMVQNRKLEELIAEKYVFIAETEEEIDWIAQRIEKKNRVYYQY
ncbi:MAG: DUF2799 domain-containing protein [Desulfobacterales bacterium]|nr:DUF2799 domain-containing protein [Desulfobacterales bacterium]